MWQTKSSILLLFLLTQVLGLDGDEKIPLHFSYITTLTGDFVASGGIPIIDKALMQINSREDILQNYTLNYTTILDSKVHSKMYLMITNVTCISSSAKCRVTKKLIYKSLTVITVNDL